MKIINTPRKIKVFLESLKFIILFPIAKIIYRNKNIFVIAERGDDARDNGLYMFRFIRTHHPDIDVYFVISKDSNDLDNVIPYGNIVYYRSIKHYLIFFAAKARLSTHLSMCAPDGSFYRKLRELRLLPGKRICLQHGITKDNMRILAKDHAFLDMLISGAEPEYRYLLENFGYDNAVVKYTGFARFDGLHDLNIKKQVLFMPTWRRTLRGASQEDFSKSSFFHKWNELLNDHRILSCLEENDIELIFYPHYEVQPYLLHFTSKSKKVSIASKSKYDVQTLLKESCLLVTDFSSVFFDYAYMRKPVIYYQFDEDDFFASHYNKGYFDYRTMGFGPVCVERDMVVEEIINIVKAHFAMKDCYSKRMYNFFPLNDNHNCERIFNEVQRCFTRESRPVGSANASKN